MRRRQLLTLLAPVLLGPVLAACGSGDSSSSGAQAAQPSTLAVSGADYSFANPSSVAAGLTTIQFTNAGTVDHQAQLARIDSGHTAADLVQALKGEGLPDWFHGTGGVHVLAAGKSASITQVIPPGSYVFICFVRSGGPPHFVQGMLSSLTVTGDAGTAALASTSAAVVAKEYSYDLPAFKAGSNTFTVRNDGPAQIHEFAIAKLNPGITVDQLKAALRGSGGPPKGPPPYTAVGGAGGFDPGGSGVVTATFDAGTQYVFICFIPDRSGGPPHAIGHGMVTGFTVTG